MTTTTDPWAPITDALAHLEHAQRMKLAMERVSARQAALRTDWNALTPAERDAIRDGEEYTPFSELPESAEHGLVPA